jgi:glycosyltransferase involved in cell wall biosynthesis
LATFAAALGKELERAGDQVVVVDIDDTGRHEVSSRARHRLVNGSPESIRDTARVLSQCDVAIVQHEYGIYGGVDGDEIIDVLRALSAPAIVILHTVPAQPSMHQKSVLEMVCDLAARVVVMTVAAGTRLTAGYDVDDSKVVTIPHGASLAIPGIARELDHDDRPQLVTWGLLGPGKGIEHAIRAVSILKDRTPRMRYTVAGATHPKVFARDGDRYRQSLIRAAQTGGVASAVRFDDTYRDVPALVRFAASASLVVLPYDSRDQVTSGVLVDAIAAGRPVIATAFPHAVELLSTGAGIVVPHGDPAALAEAIHEAVSDPARLEDMAACASAIAPSLSWHAVAARYRDLCETLAPVTAAVTA